ncbi:MULTISPECIES: MDR family MFS transporter [Streptomyces]|uniref:High-copy suppressor of rspA n=1 Tax=Streptomyces chartreusis NRRL 3882 TaxID=1079985 RepID=A0A2N9BFA6_STRCX|nr:MULTISPECIES: MDR family MFS transporter [Streptomyces]MYS95417.1 DHA2 family efflux MFS transporter permease subunit [Streptomyces sp. SID5464]SOR82020.1 High-copy suppressor of rspA [Streptomyces chartreusis NRRL 3882]
MKASGTQSPPVPGSDRVDPALRRLTYTLIVGALAVIFDTTIMSVAIDSLVGQLHTSLATIQWVTTAYLLALSATMPTVGWAQSVLGGKRLWILALGLFLAGSMLCAAAWNAPSLIAFRVLQGIGGGIMMVLMATLAMQAAGGRNIGKVMSLITVPTALGPVVGPVIGGVILHLGDWRWIFLFNIPFCLVGAYLAWRNLPEDGPRPGTTPRLDLVGTLLLSPGIAAVIYGLTQLGGPDSFIGIRAGLPLLAGVVLLTGYLAWALRRGADALLDIRLLRHRALASSTALLLLAGAALYGAMLLMPLYWQQVRGESALGAAILLIPQGVGTLLSRSLAGKYMDRIGARPVAVIAFAVTFAATMPFGFVTATMDNSMLMAVLFVRGLGLGAAMIALMGGAFVGLRRQEIPAAASISRVAQQIGGSIGTAILVMILQHATAGTHTRAALASGFGDAFWWAAVFTAAAVPLCLLLPRRADPERQDQETTPDAPSTEV